MKTNGFEELLLKRISSLEKRLEKFEHLEKLYTESPVIFELLQQGLNKSSCISDITQEIMHTEMEFNNMVFRTPVCSGLRKIITIRV